MGGSGSNLSTTQLELYQRSITNIGQRVDAKAQNKSIQSVNIQQKVNVINGPPFSPCEPYLKLLENCLVNCETQSLSSTCEDRCVEIYKCPDATAALPPIQPTIECVGGNLCIGNEVTTDLDSSQITSSSLQSEMVASIANMFHSDISKTISQTNENLNYGQLNKSNEMTSVSQTVKNSITNDLNNVSQNFNDQFVNQVQEVNFTNYGLVRATASGCSSSSIDYSSCDNITDTQARKNCQTQIAESAVSGDFKCIDSVNDSGNNCVCSITNKSSIQIKNDQNATSVVENLFNADVTNDLTSKYAFDLEQYNKGINPFDFMIFIIIGIIVLIVVIGWVITTSIKATGKVLNLVKAVIPYVFIIVVVGGIIGVVVWYVKKRDSDTLPNIVNEGNREPANVPGSLTHSGQTFKNIGTGPAIDQTVMNTSTWLKSNEIGYINHENVSIDLPSERYRSIVGFTPPSFTYYPNGKEPGTYKQYDNEIDTPAIRVDEGRNKCFDTCIETNCSAVQTEVPELCYETRYSVQDPDDPSITIMTKNTCDKSNEPSHGCTLYYNSVNEADDAYYDISNQSEIESAKLGRKYYDLNPNPTSQPLFNSNPGIKPSELEVKWCNADITPESFNDKYATVKDSSSNCSCTNDDVNCTDPNCCVFRELLTTDWAKHNTPYYNLPVDATSSTEKACKALNQSNECCGLCEDPVDSGNFVYKSCPMTKQGIDGTFNPSTSSSWWVLDVAKDKCNPPLASSTWWDKINPTGIAETIWDDNNETPVSTDTCLTNFENAYNDDKELAESELTKCCEFKDVACINLVSQPTCEISSSARGCFGNPPILNTDTTTKTQIKACSDTSLISNEYRCSDDISGKLCTAFPYSCGPNQGTLWKMN